MKNNLGKFLTVGSLVVGGLVVGTTSVQAGVLTGLSNLQITSNVRFAPLVNDGTQLTTFSFETSAAGNFAPNGSYGNFAINKTGTTGSFEIYEDSTQTISPVDANLHILSLTLPAPNTDPLPIDPNNIIPNATTNPFLKIRGPLSYTANGAVFPNDDLDFFITSIDSIVPPEVFTPGTPSGETSAFSVSFKGNFVTPVTGSPAGQVVAANAIFNGTFVIDRNDPQQANFIGSFTIPKNVPESSPISALIGFGLVGSAFALKKKTELS